MNDFIKEPQKIESKSMEIIESLMKEHTFTQQELKVVKRVIHTTADFEYQEIIRFKNNPIEEVIKGIKEGCNIVTDTNMARVGINKIKLNQYGVEVKCYVSDEDVIKEAKARGLTRSIVGMEHAVKDKNNKIFVLGNAPTALIRLINLCKENKVVPKAIIGVPVGFVGAEESKKILHNTNIPHITILGRKGGSGVAASIINAITKNIKK